MAANPFANSLEPQQPDPSHTLLLAQHNLSTCPNALTLANPTNHNHIKNSIPELHRSSPFCLMLHHYFVSTVVNCSRLGSSAGVSTGEAFSSEGTALSDTETASPSGSFTAAFAKNL